jgi:hypothetical protein
MASAEFVRGIRLFGPVECSSLILISSHPGNSRADASLNGTSPAKGRACMLGMSGLFRLEGAAVPAGERLD